MSRPERVVGMHFFNPAPLMPLVEIVQAELTTAETVEAAAAVGTRLGKGSCAATTPPASSSIAS
jgi:3-hydroxybutyryl-CoA dehydrogenase